MSSPQEIKEFSGFIRQFHELLMKAHFPVGFSIAKADDAYFLGTNPGGEVLFSQCRVTRLDMIVNDHGSFLLIYIDGIAGTDGEVIGFDSNTGMFDYQGFTGKLHWR